MTDGSAAAFEPLAQRRLLVTELPGPRSRELAARRAEVVAATRNKQVPWSNSSLLGEVFLVGGKS